MKKFIIIVAMLSMMILCVACGSENDVSEKQSIEKDKQESTKPIQVVDEYTTNEYSVVHSAELVDFLNTDITDNVIISETSLNMALSMVLEGANSDEESYADLINFLDNSVYENDITSIRNRNNWLINSYANNENVTLRLANSIWVNNPFTINETYDTNIRTYYNGEVNSLDFLDSSTINVINDWCSDKTDGCIDNVVSPEFLATNNNLIINALYFNGLWENPFPENRCIEEDFNNADGSTSTVTMMYDYDAGAYYSNDQAEAFMKYYEGRNIAFVGILPKSEDFTVSELNIDELLETADYGYEVHAIMPSFKVEDNNTLLQYLNEQLPIASTSTYHNIINEEPMNINGVLQYTYVDVNPEGTEAAAVTVIGMKNTSYNPEPTPIVEIRLDRPFVFMIYDTENHEVLFMGRINQL